MAVEIGQTLDGKYRIVRAIGVGGMGTVYEGEHTLIRRRVAIKVLGGDSARTPDSVRRFEREAQAAGQIGSDHILEVLDLGTTQDGQRYMVMEYLEGRTLATHLEHVGRMTAAEIAPVARQMLAGLAAAHQARIVHRDLKPSNVFILREKAGLRGFVKIIDFGISKFDETAAPSRLTESGAVLGTPFYMSPEQARGEAVDARSDLHAVGVILFEAVTGRAPFDGRNFNELMFQIGAGPRPRPTDFAPGLDPRFAAIIERAMKLRSKDRYQSAKELSRDLEAWMHANSLATTTGEVVLADLPARPLLGDRVDKGALTVGADGDGFDRRRTVTNASIDTLTPTGTRARRLRWRWMLLAAGAACGFVIASAALVISRQGAPATAEPAQAAPSPPPLETAVAAPVPPDVPVAGAAAAPSGRAVASPPPDAADAGAARGPEPNRRTKPPRVARPAATKPVDFGY
jgi:serine/threonine-protein kinase